MALEISREASWTLLCEWTESDSLRRHMLAVEAAMRAYARRFGEDEDLWGATGLLHDLDYDRYPDLETGHPRHALKELEARGYPPELVRAVASHAAFLGVSRDSRMEKTLFAVDGLAAVGTAVQTPGRRRRTGHVPGLPVRALDDPRHDVLQAAEHRVALAGGLRRAKAVVGRDGLAAPVAGLTVHADILPPMAL